MTAHRGAALHLPAPPTEAQQAAQGHRPPAEAPGPGRVFIRGQRTKWGNCSALRNLSFNWRLVLAPPRVLDYVVVHELAHLVEPAHSAKFWLLVRSFCPRYEEDRAWLRDHETELYAFPPAGA